MQKDYVTIELSYLKKAASVRVAIYKDRMIQRETANGSLNQLWFLGSYLTTWITVAILELIHAAELRPSGTSAFIRPKPIGPPGPFTVVTLYNFGLIARARPGDVSFKCLPYQLSMVGYAPTMVVTGDGESGFDSGEGA
ncbi:tumor differentially expressed protein [Caerostris darwini]|uniref:Tumor differentially expressed protein n=1 Tax=Caerostris darwini TaxID=1538125 RepID=A0AAV4QZ38_9ARAC|nr:tumor differentially expressed protein [Caerostris darwini]